jgi:RES domain-containing protein
MVWPKGQAIHRIHEAIYPAATFNPGIKGNARFSPIKDRTAKPAAPICVLYGGETFDCAVMETAFHDVPFAPGLKTYDKQKLENLVHSVLIPTSDLALADLSNVALRKLGIPRNQLIDTEKACYPKTRKWAEAIFVQTPDVQGLCWTSRQDDRSQAIVLFGDRIAVGALLPKGNSRSLVKDARAYMELLNLAELIGVNIVSPLP